MFCLSTQRDPWQGQEKEPCRGGQRCSYMRESLISYSRKREQHLLQCHQRHIHYLRIALPESSFTLDQSRFDLSLVKSFLRGLMLGILALREGIPNGNESVLAPPFDPG